MADDFAFLDGAGEVGRLIAAFDWSRTPLGPIAAWPGTLRAAVGLVLRAPTAMVLLWGEDGRMLYNAAYAAIVGARHPAILGDRVVDAFPEIAAFNRHVIETCLAGGVLVFKDRHFTLSRAGMPEEVWLDLNYSPVPDEAGRPAGVLAVVIETTARNLADERLRIAQDAAGFGAFEWFPRQQRLIVSDAYRDIFGLRSKAEVTETDVVDLVLPEDRKLTGVLRLAEPGNPLAYAEFRIRHGVTGQTRWIARRGKILEDANAVAPRYLGVAWDITERKRAELEEAFLAALGQQLQNVGDASRVIAIAARMLGTYLGVGRVGYGEMNDAGTHLVITHGWDDGRMPPFGGAFRVDEFGGRNLALVRAGVILRYEDVQTDPQLAAPHVVAGHQRIGVRALLGVPLLRDGGFAGVLFAHCATARHWSDSDVALVLAVVGRVWDAVQRARAEQRLRESEAIFRLFAEAMPNQVWAAGPDGGFTWCNALVYTYCGAAAGTMDGQGWWDAVHPADRDAALRAWRTAVDSGAIYEQKFRLCRADGCYRWHLTRALPIRSADGTRARWIGTSTDIEEQQRTLAELARLNATLKELVAERTRERDRLWTLSRDPLLIADRRGTWLSASPAWTSLLGWTQAELVGRTAAWMAHPEDPPLALSDPQPADAATTDPRAAATTDPRAAATTDPRAAATTDPRAAATTDPRAAATTDPHATVTTPRLESRFRARDGSYRWFAWTSVAEDGLLYCVARDVTAEKAAAARLQQAEAALRQSQKMEAIGQLTGGIAHDFNNLLTGILGALELARRRMADGRSGDLDRLMDVAMASAQRAAVLTQRLLAFARRQSLDDKPVPIGSLVLGMAELLRRTLGEQVRLEIAVPPDLWHAATDPNQLENAILNLAINARDAMPDGGRLTIAATNVWRDEGAADLTSPLPAGDYVAIAVTDTGAGMPKAVQERAFEPFFTTKPVGQGTGLGLSMVYGFVHQCGGGIRIDSAPGRGTTVEFLLRRALRPEQPAAVAAEAPRGAGETVLVVEDDPAVRMLVIEVLRELGYRTLEATDAESAMPILASGCALDLMVSDVGLPGLNGRQIADFGRTRMPELKVLFLTGYAEQAATRSGFLAPGMDMMTKPFAIETLAAKVNSMIRGG